MQRAYAVLYCHLWPARLYNVLSHYPTNGTIIEIRLLNIKYLFGFPVQILSETFLILRIIERDMIKKRISVFT